MARTWRESWVVVLWVAVIVWIVPTLGQDRETVYQEFNDTNGVTRQFAVDRYPALFSGDFADCLGGQSLFNITKFDTGYFKDNRTVVFHLDGNTNVRQENLIMHITVEAYGKSRFDTTFDPCGSPRIDSLCPLNADRAVEAWAAFPISPNDVEGMPSISLDIPDFEGSATLRLFANSSETEIGCFRAVMHNGRSFSHPNAISSALGGLTAIAILSSFATAIYGVSIPHIRTHYAHAFSVLVIFEAFQTIYFSGALSVSWPSVLPAFWSNFAWSAGLIYSESIVDSLAGFAGISGNASQVGGAGSAVINTEGGLVQQIYGRSVELLTPKNLMSRAVTPYNASDPYDYKWGGNPVTPGMPLPGTWQGFPGTLSMVEIPAAGAFLVALIWWIVAIGLVAASVTACKLLLDFLAATNIIKADRFTYFRSHLPGYLAASVLRTLLIASPALITLALFQFNIKAPAGPTAIAAIIFLLVLVGMGGLVAYACYFRLRFGKFETGPDIIVFEKGTLFNVVPFIAATRASNLGEKETSAKRYGSMPFFRVRFIDDDPNRTTVHKDEAYIKRFGWLAAHYRRSRWWFFALWFSYQFIRACFLGGGVRSPLAQVYGLFIFEIISFVVFIKLSPYEGRRNSTVAIWLMGVSKIITAGFSIAFLPEFGIGRILSTILGIFIIVVQAFLVLAVLALVILGAFSSWMSLHRNRETFKPEKLDGIRIQYYEHMQNTAPDMPPPPKADANNIEAVVQTFQVNDVRRTRKIEDEDDELTDLEGPSNSSAIYLGPINRSSRANSVSSRYSVGSLPRRARPHRTSWSAKDFAEWDAQSDRAPARPESLVGGSTRPLQAHNRQRSSSLRQIAHLNSQASLKMPQDIPELPRTSSEARRPMTPTREVSEDKLETLETLHSEKGKDKVADDDSDAADGKSKTIPFPPLPEHDEDKL
ncbi:putative membrane protein like [Verticillium longisporum]|nr:putative membrane protein like [Verticillium longisporum]